MSDQSSSTMKTSYVRDVAPGVRQVAVGHPFVSYAYLLDSPEGTIAFDTGVRGSGPEILAAAAGPVAKINLSHAHAAGSGGLGRVPTSMRRCGRLTTQKELT